MKKQKIRFSDFSVTQKRLIRIAFVLFVISAVLSFLLRFTYILPFELMFVVLILFVTGSSCLLVALVGVLKDFYGANND